MVATILAGQPRRMDDDDVTEREYDQVDSELAGIRSVSSRPTPYLEFIRKRIFPDAVRYTPHQGALMIIIERRLAGGMPVEANIPLWQIADLMRRCAVGEQLPLL